MKETTPTSHIKERKEYFWDIIEKEVSTCILVHQECTEYLLAIASGASLV